MGLVGYGCAAAGMANIAVEAMSMTTAMELEVYMDILVTLISCKFMKSQVGTSLMPISFSMRFQRTSSLLT